MDVNAIDPAPRCLRRRLLGFLMPSSTVLSLIVAALSHAHFVDIAHGDTTSGLMAHWRFDEGSGTTAASAVGGNTGTLLGPTWTTGKVGGALSFDGINDHVHVTSSAALNSLTDLTVSAWVYPVAGGGGGFGRILRKGGAAPGRFNLHINSSGTLVFRAGYANDASWTSATIPFNAWSHVVVTYTHGNKSRDPRVYVNGALRGVTAGARPSGNSLPDDNHLWMGDDGTRTRVFSGRLDEVRIYNRILTDSDVTALYAASPPPPSGVTYYVSPSGSDSYSGSSPSVGTPGPGSPTPGPWRTINRVNAHTFKPGDKILFQGGALFPGGLLFDTRSQGSKINPILVSSYGTGRATIDAGVGTCASDPTSCSPSPSFCKPNYGNGICAYNTAGFEIRNLRIVGAGPSLNRGTGVLFHTDYADRRKLEHVVIADTEIFGFGDLADPNGPIGYGIRFHGTGGGYRSVRIERVSVHDVAKGGIRFRSQYPPPYVVGAQLVYGFEDVYIGYADVFNVSGIGGLASHTGNGILLGQVNGGMVERSVVHDVGWLSDSLASGPGAIWTANSNRVTLQYNEAYNTYSRFLDGNGFDLDEGVTNSVMQYNYSHDNDGAGFLLAQNSTAFPHASNVVRYNISQNDCRRRSCGAIHLWGTLRRDIIHNNVVFVSRSPWGGAPRAFVAEAGGQFAFVYNNIFATTDGLRLIEVADGSALTFRGNMYSSETAPDAPLRNIKILWNGVPYNNSATRLDAFSRWVTATGQETIGGAVIGRTGWPDLAAAGVAPTLDDADLLSSLSHYRLTFTSSLIDSGVALPALTNVCSSDPNLLYCAGPGVDPAVRDFFGTVIPKGVALERGVEEKAADAPTAVAVAPGTLTFSVVSGEGAPPPQWVTISSTGGAPYSWAISEGIAWLTVTPNSGAGPRSVAVSVNPAGLPPGSHTGTITVTSPQDPAGPRTISVKLNVAGSSEPNLVGRWSFSEGSGTSTADVSGNHGTGTLINGPAWVVGHSGSGLLFDGIDDRVEIGSTAMVGLSDMTLSAWIYAMGGGGGGYGYIAKKGSGIPGRFALHISSNAIVTFRAGFATEGIWRTSNAIAFNQWTHIAVTYRHGLVTADPSIYVNGVLQPLVKTAPTGSPLADDAAFTIGDNGIGTRVFRGVIDEVRVYDRLLNAAEINAILSSD